MTADHYATLGVAPTTEDVVIRAAYLALMRRYHPDTNASPAAAARVRAINAAYKVLGDQDRRADYDRKRSGHAAPDGPSALKDYPVGQIIFAVILLLLVPLFALAMRSSPSLPRPLEDRAHAPSDGIQAAAGDPAAGCASQAAQGQIKRELFRQAAELRGTDSAAFEATAAQSLVRVDSPTITGGGDGGTGVICRAFVAIDLPPGVSAAGGRTVLAGEIGYSVKAGSVAGGDMIILSDGDLITGPLASLTHVPDPADELANVPDISDPMPAEVRPRLAEQPVVSKPPPPPRPASSRPRVRADPKAPKPLTRASGASSLADLDRHVNLLTSQSVRYGDAAKRAGLFRTQKIFLARRDACRSDSCARDAYLDRMREVATIMSDKPQPSP